MAWRIDEQVTHGELDNRTCGRVSGTLWLFGQAEPVRVDLKGHPWRDWAGCVLRFRNPTPKAGDLAGFALEQTGVCGDMTVSRKVRIPPEPVKEWLAQGAPGKDSLPWGNAVYLEWFSDCNGRVVIETTRYEVQISERAWSMTEEQEQEQQQKNSEAMDQFMVSLTKAMEQEATENESAGQTEKDSEEGDVDQALRLMSDIEDLKQRARDISGGEMVEGGEQPLPLEVQHQFWKNVVDFESAPRKIRREILAEDGFHALCEEGLSDTELSTQLWLLIHALAARRMYLECTNHLSDRALYKLLIEQVLEEETEVLPPEAEWNCRICIHEYGAPGDEDGTDIYLRFYADEETRAQWLEQFSGDIPPHAELPYDRDRHLPG
jgi:hypothetical protein